MTEAETTNAARELSSMRATKRQVLRDAAKGIPEGPKPRKNRAAQQLGRLGGKARAKAMTPAERTAHMAKMTESRRQKNGYPPLTDPELSPQERRKKRFRMAGKCVTCGKPRPKDLKNLCRSCADKANAKARDKVLSPSERKALGLAAIKERRKATPKGSE